MSVLFEDFLRIQTNTSGIFDLNLFFSSVVRRSISSDRLCLSLEFRLYSIRIASYEIYESKILFSTCAAHFLTSNWSIFSNNNNNYVGPRRNE